MIKKIVSYIVMIAIIMPLFTGLASPAYADDDAPIEIYTVADLYAINNNLSGNYILMNDIDLSEVTKPDGRYSCNGHGWKPIGGNASFTGGDAFTGTFDGQGYTIKGMNVQFDQLGADRYVGLFYNNTGLIKNLILKRISIKTSEYEADSHTLFGGALVAKNSGRIENIQANSGEIFAYCGNIGGIVGIAYKGRLDHCTNNLSIEVKGKGINYLGGIVGRITQEKYATIEIVDCGNTGNIIIFGDQTNTYSGSIGGIVGVDENYYSSYSHRVDVGQSYYITTDYYYSDTLISKCFNSGSIIADGNINDYSYIGGILGGFTNSPHSVDKNRISNCYNCGELVFEDSFSADDNKLRICGIAGQNSKISSCYNIASAQYPIRVGSTCSDSYYLGETDSTTSGAVALTEAQMKDPDFMPGLDFENTWILDPDSEYPYPQLRSNPQDLDPKIDTIELTSEPIRQEYRTGDQISAEGGMLHVYYFDGTERDIEVTDDMLSGYDMSTPGVQDVTITLKKHTVTYKISVSLRPEISSVTLYSGPNQTTFVRGTAFDFTGAVAHVAYVDGTSEDIQITPEMTTGGDINQSGNYTISFEYQGYVLTFDVTVVPLKMTGLTVSSLPDKTVYVEGQELDTAGLVVDVNYNSGATKTLTDSEYTLEYDNSVGTQTVTVKYQNFTATFNVTFTAKVVTDLQITRQPDKVQYVQYQPLDVTGMIVTATYDDDTSEEVTDYELGEMTDAMGYQSISVSYGGKTTYFQVYVTLKKVISLEIANFPDKTQYYAGDQFDPTGMVVEAHYNDGTSEIVTDYAMTSLPAVPGDRTIIVTYQGVTAAVPVTVVENNAVEIRVTPPTKTSYIKGETFDPTGMEVLITYANGKTEAAEDYTVEGFGETDEANLVTVAYADLSYSFIVTIHEPRNSWTVIKNATCSEEGVEELHCKHCNEILDTRTIAMTDHMAGNWETETEATCTAKGLKVKRCTMCNEIVESEEIPMKEHTAGSWEVTKEATCSATGTKVKKCTECGEVIETSEIPLAAHTPGAWEVTKEPTCTATGIQRLACSKCGAIIKYENIDMTDHIPGPWEITKPATYTETGLKVRKCKSCDEVIDSEEIPVLKQKISIEDKKVELSSNYFIYTGDVQKPTIVSIGDTILKEGTDYNAKWSVGSPKNVGSYTVTITGIGNYTGQTTGSFRILFKDVPAAHSYQNAVYWSVDNGIAAGYTGDKIGVFGVNDDITRGQVVMFLWRAAGKKEPKSNTLTFTDVPTSHAFYKAVQWAYEQGITGGYSGARSGQFGPNDSCTRGQIAMFLWRYSNQPKPKKSTQTFTDVPANHNFYKAIQWASEQGITAGYKDKSFGVDKTCTRGHCVTFLYRMLG